MIYGRNGSALGWTECGKIGSTIGIELDLRSHKKEERTLRFIVDKKIQNCCIVGLPAEIRFGVCTVILLLVILLLAFSDYTWTGYSDWVCELLGVEVYWRERNKRRSEEGVDGFSDGDARGCGAARLHCYSIVDQIVSVAPA